MTARSRLLARNAAVLLGLVAALVFGSVSAWALGALEPTTTWKVTPLEQSFPGGRTCRAGTTLLQDRSQSVTDGVGEGTASATYTVDGVPVTIDLTAHADNSFDFDVTGAVSFVKTVVNGSATVADGEIGLNGSVTAEDGPWTYNGSGGHTCSLDESAYGANGSYGGTVDNTATVTGSDGQSDSDGATTEYVCSIRPAPSIDIEKATNGEDADTPTGPRIPVGDAVHWTYVVTNTGNADLTGVVVTDDQGVSVTCPKDEPAAGEPMACTGTAAPGQ